MGLDRWMSRFVGHRRAVALASLMAAFTGLTMVLNPTHAAGLEWIGIPLLVGGVPLLVWATWPSAIEARIETQSLGSRLLHRLTLRGRLVRMFPIVGVGIIAADLVYNFLLSSSPALLTEDVMVLLTATVLLVYYFVPPAYRRERDFALIFFLVLDAVLVAPLLLVRFITRNVDASVDLYSWAAVAPQLSSILSLLGVANSVHSVAGFTAPGLSFTPLKMSVPVTVVISTSCSGIYSFGIFASAFVAFLLTEYERPSRRLWLILAIGFLTSYIANLLRMAIIVLVGYYTDSVQSDLQNLLLAHSYAGWIVFLGWLALFWGLLFRFLPVEMRIGKAKEEEANPQGAVRGGSASCGICNKALNVTIPAIRCGCGAFYHRICLSASTACPSCHHDLGRGLVRTGEGPSVSNRQNLH
jgi:exosortase/archaeosortase family protein